MKKNRGMVYSFFIDCTNGKGWEVAKIMCCEISINRQRFPNYISTLCDIQSYSDFVNVIGCIEKKKLSDTVIIYIDAHSSDDTITFNPTISERYAKEGQDYITWGVFYNSLQNLIQQYNNNMLLILGTCCSASYLEANSKRINVPIIAAEGILTARCIEAPLYFFYEEISKGESFTTAYNKMVDKFPQEREVTRKGNDIAKLKLFCTNATLTT